jgi:glycosyltransferase involved in cell wall biosynthesis
LTSVSNEGPLRRVAIVQRAVFRYRAPFYELLRARLRASGIELVLVHSNPPEDVWGSAVDLPWAHRVPRRTVRVGRRELLWQPCLHLVRGCDLIIVEQASQNLLNYVLFVQQFAGRRRVALWGHGRSFGADPHRLGEASKRWWSRRAHWWFAYTDLAADIVRDFGMDPARITVVRNAIDTRELRTAIGAMTEDDAASTRDGLGLTGLHTALYLGRLASEKRLDYLCEAIDAARAAVADLDLVIAGAGPEEERVRAFAATRPWVHVVGPVHGDDKAALLRVADVLLMPASSGLVVLDSFAAGIPMVVGASLPHGPEVSYLDDGVNGLVVDDRGDPRRYGAAVAELLIDRERLDRLRAGSSSSADEFTIEAMVERFATGVVRALAR